LGVILVATIAVLAATVGRTEVCVVALVVAGSLCGFLRFNFPPGSIFLGDAGSTLIGFVIGALAIQGSLKGAGTVLLAAPLAVWTLPILDSTAAILRRKLSGRSLYATDRGHLHHRLLERFGTTHRVLITVAVCCAITSSAALASILMHNDLVAVTVCAALVIVLAATGLFGQAEFVLLWTRARGALHGVAPISPSLSDNMTNGVIRLQGSRQWEVLWETVSEAAAKLHLNRVFVDLNLPALHENLSATWERPGFCDRERCWQVDLPLMVTGHMVGRLVAVSVRNGAPMCREIEPVFELVEAVESQLGAFLEAAGDARPHRSSPVSVHPLPEATPCGPKQLGRRAGRRFPETR
jgi:UDP-GlcNAc:undecaprenyl-phosphate/decaprenyl-phosphate GlcNAc-1-phosphate transferase